MYVLDSMSTNPWMGTLDDVYPVKIENITPSVVEPNTTFSINFTLRNTHSTTPWLVWAKLYQGTSASGTLLLSFDSGTTYVQPNGTYSAPATVISGGISTPTNYFIEAGHITLDAYLFTASENPPAGGSISGTPDGNIVAGDPVSVTASSPNPGYYWGGWGATGITLSNPDSLTQAFNMPANVVTLTANFPLLNTYSFSRSADPPAGGSINGTGNGSYAQGYSVSVTASSPNPGYYWGGWSATGITLSNPDSLTQAFNMPATTVTLTANYDVITPTGACCVETNCNVTTQVACAGTYQGDGTTCSPNPCDTGNCSQYGTPQACALNGCYWWSDGSCHDAPEPSCNYGNVNDCINNGCQWWNNGCHANSPTCTEINNSSDCGYYGCYWWSDGSCHDAPEPPPCSNYNNDPQGCAAAGCVYDWQTNTCGSGGAPPIQQNMLIVGAAVLGGLTIIALLSRSRGKK